MIELPNKIKLLFPKSEVRSEYDMFKAYHIDFTSISNIQTILIDIQLIDQSNSDNFTKDVSERFINMIKNDYITHHIFTFQVNDIKSLIPKLLMSSNFVATEGRIGPATHIIISKDLAYKFGLVEYYNIEYIVHPIKLDYLKDFTIFVDSRIDNDNIFVWRDNDIDLPGIKLFWIPENRDDRINSILDNNYIPPDTKWNLTNKKGSQNNNQYVKLTVR